MENSSIVSTDDGLRTYWPMARAAHVDLHLMTMQRVNLLLMGTDAVVQSALRRLRPNLRGPILTWAPNLPLELPPPGQSGTLILRDVGRLPPADQLHLLEWLEQSGGRTQVISTTASMLLSLVESSEFHDTLYYRLNVACLDLTD